MRAFEGVLTSTMHAPFADPLSELLALAVAFDDPPRAPWCRRIMRRYARMYGTSAIEWVSDNRRRDGG